MGDRYFLTVKCSKCGLINKDVYYAPTCGIFEFKCNCGDVINLKQYSGISYEDCSNADLIEEIIDKMK